MLQCAVESVEVEGADSCETSTLSEGEYDEVVVDIQTFQAVLLSGIVFNMTMHTVFVVELPFAEGACVMLFIIHFFHSVAVRNIDV